jgi:molecular chaperone GrpE
MVQGQFLEKLQALGLSVIDPQGQPFDPNEADALDVSPASSPEEDNRVSRVYSRGYRMNDRVIRPARVQVARLSDEG